MPSDSMNHLSSPSERIQAIDALRGLLMCVIIFSHALICLDAAGLSMPVRLGLDAIVRFGGTPGFCMVSGMLLGYFIVTKADFGRVAHSYRRRALQLILIAHLLISLALFGPLGSGESFASFFLRRWYITDNLALFFAVGPWLLPKLSPAIRLMLGASLLLAARMVYAGITPATGPAMLALDIMVSTDPLRPTVLLASYGLAPTAGYFLIGSFLGHRFAGAMRADALPQHLYRLRRSIPALVALTVLLVGAWGVWKLDWLGSGNDFIQRLLYPDRALTLFPAYLGLFLAALILLVHRTWPHGARTAPERALVIFGKTSLFTYVAQYLVVQTIPWAFGWTDRMSLLQFALFLAIVYPLLLALARGYLWFLQRGRVPREKPAPAPA